MENEIFLTIKEVSQKTGLSAHTLRFYERVGLIHPVQRADNHHRRYSQKDLEWIDFLTRLRSTGMPVKEMAAYARMVADGDSTVMARRRLMEGHRDAILDQIDQLQAHLKRIESKVAYYRAKEDALKPKS